MWIAITMLILLTLLALAYLAILDGSYRVKRNQPIQAAPAPQRQGKKNGWLLNQP
jgi:hypothetical protein